MKYRLLDWLKESVAENLFGINFSVVPMEPNGAFQTFGVGPAACHERSMQ